MSKWQARIDHEKRPHKKKVVENRNLGKGPEGLLLFKES